MATRAQRGGRLLRILAYTAGFVLLAVVAALVIVVANVEKLTPHATRWITSSTGREFRVDGSSSLRVLTWRPRLELNGVTYANPEGSKEPRMLDVGHFEVSLSLRRLLRGEVVIPRLRLRDATIRLEQRADGSNNWTLWAAEAAAPNDRTNVPAIRHVRLRNTRLLYSKEGAPESATDLDLASAKGMVAEKVRLIGEGKYQKHRASLAIVAGSVEELQVMEQPFPIELAVRTGSTNATINGTLTGTMDSGGLDVTMRIKGNSMSDLYPLIGVVLPPSPPYQLTGKLGHEGTVWKFAEFSGRMGDSDLTGNLSVDTAPKRPFMKADFRSKLLDFDDLGGLVGAPAATGAGETASAEQKQQAAKQDAEGRVLPDTPVDVPRLQAMDIDARLVAARVKAPNHVPVDKLDMHVTLKDGTLRTEPAQFDVANGRVLLNATIDSKQKPLRVDVDFQARGLQAARILGPTPFTDETAGKIGGQVKLAMRGNSLRQMAATADGSAKLVMADARVSHMLMELIGLDIAQAIGVALRGDKPLPIRCAAMDLEADNGKVHSNLFVIDTEDTNVTADVSLNLGTEMLDVRVAAHPRDPTLLSMRQDLRIEGRLADLDFYPDPLKLGKVKGLMQKIDYMLAPIVGLLTSRFDIGTQDKHDDNGCGQFLRDHSGEMKRTAPRAKPSLPQTARR